MGNYFIDITDQAREDIRHWNKVGDEVILKKNKRILFELSEHPKEGRGRAGRKTR